jgi:hypothetical protein
MKNKTDTGPDSALQTSDYKRTVDSFTLFSSGLSGPLAERFQILAEAARTAPRRAGAAFALGWGMLLVITLLSGSAFGDNGFLTDASAFARFAIAVPLLILMDKHVDARLRGFLAHFTDAPLIAPRALPAAGQAVVTAIDYARATMPAWICAALAYLLSALYILSVKSSPAADASSWRFTGSEADLALSLAGWWATLVAIPLLGYLMLRALWRYMIWVWLMRRIARLELRLVASHPDGAGGLRFLGQNANAFTSLAFAMSVTVAGYILKGLDSGALSTEIYGWMMSAWAAIIVGLFSAPMLAFAKPLTALKIRTRLAAAARATVNQRAAEREVFGRNFAGWQPGDPEEPPADKDAAKIDEAAKKLSTLPFSRAAIVPLGAAALLPLVLVGATQLPFKELFKAAKGLLLL